MADEIVTIELSHPWREFAVGDRLKLERDDAAKLVWAGAAKYATKADAKKAGADPDDFTLVASVAMPAELREASKASRQRSKRTRDEQPAAGVPEPAEA
jgi:hypothetical protein